jgi:hypothetical protein
MSLLLPDEVAATLREFRTCELTTIGRDGYPSTWPTSASFEPEVGRFVLTTSIAFPQKALNIRRDPRVSMLYSDPTGSSLEAPAAVLVQGDAVCPEEVHSSVRGMERYWRDTIFRRQPATDPLGRNPFTRKMMDWYFMRLQIVVAPRVVTWWPAGDFEQEPKVLVVTAGELSHVG